MDFDHLQLSSQPHEILVNTQLPSGSPGLLQCASMQQFVAIILPPESQWHGLHALTTLSSFTLTSFMDCTGIVFLMFVSMAPA
jgi:hypothetical protein